MSTSTETTPALEVDLPEYVTWSDKTGLIAHDRKFNFLTQIQSSMSVLLDSLPVITGLLCLGPLAICASSVGHSWCHGQPVSELCLPLESHVVG